MNKQITNNILMIRPKNFGYNHETAKNNFYQKNLLGLTVDEIQKRALLEFDMFVDVLKTAGVNVIVIEDVESLQNPDAIFPNNWFSTHENGKVVIYPMYAENRRTERRRSIFYSLENEYNFDINKIVDFVSFEQTNQYLEGTGSMVLDRENKICYAAISHRTDEEVLMNFCNNFNYRLVSFSATQEVKGETQAIYHTNVMMSIAERFAIVCLDSIVDQKEKDYVCANLNDSGREIISITIDQKNQFAGNMLQLFGDKKYLVMSSSAYNSLNKKQISRIEQYCSVLHSSLDTIESCGGGSARCMMAEIFLHKAL
jgi:hypothetical protein